MPQKKQAGKLPQKKPVRKKHRGRKKQKRIIQFAVGSGKLKMTVHLPCYGQADIKKKLGVIKKYVAYWVYDIVLTDENGVVLKKLSK